MSRPSFQQFSNGAYRSAFNGLILLLLLFVYGTVFLLVAANYFPTGSAFITFLMTTGIVGMDILEESHPPAPSLGNRHHQIDEKRSGRADLPEDLEQSEGDRIPRALASEC